MITVTRETVSPATRRRLSAMAAFDTQSGSHVLRLMEASLAAYLVVIAGLGAALALVFTIYAGPGPSNRVMAIFLLGAIVLVGLTALFLYRNAVESWELLSERAAPWQARQASDTIEKVRFEVDDAVLLLEHENGTLVVDQDRDGTAWAFDVDINDPRRPELDTARVRTHWTWLQYPDADWIAGFSARGRRRPVDKLEDPQLSIIEIEMAHHDVGPNAEALPQSFAALKAHVVSRLSAEHLRTLL